MALIPGLTDKMEQLKSSSRPRRRQTSKAQLPDQGGGGGGGGGGSQEDVDQAFQRVAGHIYLMT